MSCGPADLQKPGYLRAVFDSLPLPTFIVDSDVRILDCNRAAAQLLGPNPELALHSRGGDALHCIHAEAKGCGGGKPCQDCVIRNSVKKALLGRATHRQAHKAEVRAHGTTTIIELLVTTTPLPDSEPPSALLILEDISELLTLRGLIPICSQCKKIRDDRQYWHSLESYLHKHMNLELTHGLCPHCFDDQMKVIDGLQARQAELATQA